MSWNIIHAATKYKVKNINYQAVVKMFISFFSVMLEIKQQQQSFFSLLFFLPATTESNRVVISWNIIPVVAKNKNKKH